MTTFAQAQSKAAQQGLTVTKAPGWSQVHIHDADGHVLDTCGLDAVPAWLCGYRAARRVGQSAQ